mmetsp:Transcript_43727/g.129440  ORF Transcript_43727/g.129440 Transcript_43727/m.129440 type:complete len:348 (+) Transcript_43727:418-1461(+)
MEPSDPPPVHATGCDLHFLGANLPRAEAVELAQDTLVRGVRPAGLRLQLRVRRPLQRQHGHPRPARQRAVQQLGALFSQEVDNVQDYGHPCLVQRPQRLQCPVERLRLCAQHLVVAPLLLQLPAQRLLTPLRLLELVPVPRLQLLDRLAVAGLDHVALAAHLGPQTLLHLHLGLGHRAHDRAELEGLPLLLPCGVLQPRLQGVELRLEVAPRLALGLESLIVAHRADRHPEAVLHSPLVLAVEVPPELLTVLPRGLVRGSELDELGMHRPDEADKVPQRRLACGRPQGSLGEVCEDIGVPPEGVGSALVALLREQPLESIGGVQGLEGLRLTLAGAPPGLIPLAGSL